MRLMRLLVASDLHGSVESLLFLLEKARELTPDALVLQVLRNGRAYNVPMR